MVVMIGSSVARVNDACSGVCPQLDEAKEVSVSGRFKCAEKHFERAEGLATGMGVRTQGARAHCRLSGDAGAAEAGDRGEAVSAGAQMDSGSGITDGRGARGVGESGSHGFLGGDGVRALHDDDEEGCGGEGKGTRMRGGEVSSSQSRRCGSIQHEGTRARDARV